MCDHLWAHLSRRWKVEGTLYLANSTWQGSNPRLKECQHLKLSTLHLVASPVYSVEAIVTVEHQTFLVEVLEQFLTQTPPTHTHPNTTHFPSYTQSGASLVGSSALPQASIASNYCSPWLRSPRANFLTQPEPISHYVTQYVPHSTQSRPQLHPPHTCFPTSPLSASPATRDSIIPPSPSVIRLLYP